MIGFMAGARNNISNSTTNAQYNFFIGNYAALSNEEGAYNMVLGHDASLGIGNNDGSDSCMVIGHGAAASPGTADRNWATVIGHQAVGQGDFNITLGAKATQTRNYAINIGYQGNVASPYAVSIGSGASVATSSNNSVVVGNQASSAATGGIAIGDTATVSGANSVSIGDGASVSGDNSIAIGYQASATGSNEVYLGNSAVASIGGVVNWTATSDGRFKTDVQEDVPGLDFINRLRPVTYHFNARKLHEQRGNCTDDLEGAFAEKQDERYTGFIAQEVESAALELGFEFSGVDAPKNEDEIYGLRYAEFSVPLVKAVQELDRKVKDQQDTIETQQAAIDQLLSALETQQAQNAKYLYVLSELQSEMAELREQVQTSQPVDILSLSFQDQ